MHAIVTVIGKDRVGIIARVCTMLSEKNVNILDINQTLMQDMFTMMMQVDIGKASETFQDLKQDLSDLGEEMGLEIRIQREDIFNAMHKI